MRKGILWAVLQSPVEVERLYPNGKPHHVTLRYGVVREEVGHLIGKEFEGRVWAIAHDSRIQALRVTLPEWVPCQNRRPHITVSWIDGASPVESSQMLYEAESTRFFEPYPVSLKIEFRKWDSGWVQLWKQVFQG